MQRAVDTLGQRLALVVTPATAQDRAQVAALAAQVQAVTGEPVALAFVDPDDTGDAAAAVAAEPGLRLEVVTLPTSTRGFVLLPRRWVVERAFPWTRQFGRLARAYERVPDTAGGRAATGRGHRGAHTVGDTPGRPDLTGAQLGAALHRRS